ncbi:MAG: glutamate synthase subunit beta, partial [Candidatus Omnitrophica bacterium]|nr:glutamate synthase subunit beta [Candidatus Omnitrophota bacterium]
RLPDDKLQIQGARCMDCGIPFCHTGCPLGNIIPDWNDLVYRGRWAEALERLHFTNNFPEFTGRVCPAPCEKACVLGINEPPVAIKQVEVGIIEHAFSAGLVEARPPEIRTGKTVAVIGSGPAGLACAAQLNYAGHTVTVFERSDRIGGLLMYGIPDFKLEKQIVNRRVDLMRKEGVQFQTNAWVGKNYPTEKLREFDAVVIAIGATWSRDLPIPGRNLNGIHLAMDFLPQQNKRCAGDVVPDAESILATGKHVIVIGGGDTGADCIGTSIRQGAASVTNIEIFPRPPEDRTETMPWPYYPMTLRVESSHQEGVLRDWSVLTKEFIGRDGKLVGLRCARLEYYTDESGRLASREVDEFELKADLVLLALGFLGPEKEGMIAELGVELDERGNVVADENYMSSVPGIFACGDSRRGQSLVVWAIAEGREAARGVDLHLMGESVLPTLDTRRLSLPVRR